jgi:hypothetical protein
MNRKFQLSISILLRKSKTLSSELYDNVIIVIAYKLCS